MGGRQIGLYPHQNISAPLLRGLGPVGICERASSGRVRPLVGGVPSRVSIASIGFGPYVDTSRRDDLGNASKREGGFKSFSVVCHFVSVIHSGLEEFYWRWFVYGQLRVRWCIRGTPPSLQPSVLSQLLPSPDTCIVGGVILSMMRGENSLAAGSVPVDIMLW